MTENFYNALAPYYKYVYSDWDASVERQANDLHEIIQEYLGEAESQRTILDVACGIGTQSIGLAMLGYPVTASDLSAGAIQKAKKEAQNKSLQIDFHVGNMKTVWDDLQTSFDVVMACDNSVPHLLSEEEILAAFRQFYACMNTGGAALITVRDYSKLERKAGEKKLVPRHIHTVGTGQLVMLDVWHFYDADHYEITTYLVKDDGSENVHVQAIKGGKYYCVEIPVLVDLFHRAGFQRVEVVEERFFQPVIVALK